MAERKYKFPIEDCNGAESVLDVAARRGRARGTVAELSAMQMHEVAKKLGDKSREEEGMRSFSKDEKNEIALALNEASNAFADDPQTKGQYCIILKLAKKFQGNEEETKT